MEVGNKVSGYRVWELVSVISLSPLRLPLTLTESRVPSSVRLLVRREGDGRVQIQSVPCPIGGLGLPPYLSRRGDLPEGRTVRTRR